MLILSTVLGIGITVGATALRDATNAELSEIAQAMCCMNQSYSFAGMTNSLSNVAGSAAADSMSNITSRDLQAHGVQADFFLVGE